MAKTDWGTKRNCLSCSKKFYDFNRNPILCPSCGKELLVEKSARVKLNKNNNEKPSKDDLPEKTLVLIYPLGDFLSFDALDEMDFLGSVHVTHKIVLDDKQIEKTLVTMKNFLSNKICIDSRKKKYILKNVGWVLKNGFSTFSRFFHKDK